MRWRWDDAEVTIFKDRTIRLSTLFYDEPTLSDGAFINCELIGPAVVVPVDCQIEGCGWDGRDLNDLVWGMKEGRDPIGAMVFRRYRFIGCHFRRIGLAPLPSQVDLMLDGFRQGKRDSG